jgi:hypothetical protein
MYNQFCPSNYRNAVQHFFASAFCVVFSPEHVYVLAQMKLVTARLDLKIHETVCHGSSNWKEETIVLVQQFGMLSLGVVVRLILSEAKYGPIQGVFNRVQL